MADRHTHYNSEILSRHGGPMGAAKRFSHGRVFLVLAGVLACGVDDTTAVTLKRPSVALEEQPVYGSCPTPESVCQFYHPGSSVSAFCSFGECFDMRSGGEVRVVAADELGPFPTTWFMWLSKDAEAQYGYSSCDLTEEGPKKTRVEIPSTRTRCRFDMSTPTSLYHEHFASNPASGCLAWLECRSY